MRTFDLRGTVQRKNLQKLVGEDHQAQKSDCDTSAEYPTRMTQVAFSNYALSTTFARENTFSGEEVEDGAAIYPRNRHTDQVCKTFYRMVKDKKQSKPMQSHLIKVNSRERREKSP